jgi:hypothetical protein
MAGIHAGLSLSNDVIGTHDNTSHPAMMFAYSRRRSRTEELGEREDAAQTRQAEELTRLTRRAAIRGPLPSDNHGLQMILLAGHFGACEP